MQPLEHNEGAIGVGTQVSANGLRGLATGMAATTEASALVPAGIDEVSLQAAMAFATEALETNALNAMRSAGVVAHRPGVRRGRR